MGRIQVRVQPGASRNEIVGFEGEVLRIRLTAPPVEGKANKALIALLGDALRVGKSRIEIVSGHSSRQKVIEVRDLEEEEIRARLVSTR